MSANRTAEAAAAEAKKTRNKRLNEDQNNVILRECNVRFWAKKVKQHQKKFVFHPNNRPPWL
jgi:hypothetical protein